MSPLPVQSGRDALELARRFGAQGKLPLQLDETIVPVVILDTLERRSEGPRLRPAAASAPAGVTTAGNLAAFGIQPPTSNVLVALDRVHSDVEVDLRVDVPDHGANFRSYTGARFRDRGLVDPPDARPFVTDYAGAPGIPIRRVGALEEVGGLDITMPPGQGHIVVLVATVADTPFRASLFWREVTVPL